MGVKISQLPAVVAPALTDIFPIVQAGVTYKETCTQLSGLIDTTLQASGHYVLTSSAADQAVTRADVATATPNSLGVGFVSSDSVPITSGALNALAAGVTIVGASGGDISALGGVVTINGGTISGSCNVTGLAGAVNLTNVTVNSGAIYAIGAEWNSTGTVQTDMSATSGIAFNNKSTDVLGQQITLSGDASYYMSMSNVTTYYAAAGTSAGSAGKSDHCAAQQVLKIFINGAAAYIPVFTQNT